MNTKDIKRKVNLRIKKKKSIRANIFGTKEIPRVTLFRSNKHIFVQAIDDSTGTTLTSIHTKNEGLKSNKESATKLGEKFAKALSDIKVDKVIYDRNGYIYHGIIATFAEALRANNIKL